MIGPKKFIHRHLRPADRLGEIMFGLVMALGITGAARLGGEEVTNRELFVAVLGCNIAWGIVDGVMFVLVGLFERGRQARMVRGILAAKDEEAALRAVAEEFDDPFGELATAEERAPIHRLILDLARRSPPRAVSVTRGDFFGGIAVAGLIFLATVPVVLPFLLVQTTEIATRLSNLTAVVMLFLLGHRWGKFTGSSPVKTGLGIALVGIVLVLVTIALGG